MSKQMVEVIARWVADRVNPVNAEQLAATIRKAEEHFMMQFSAKLVAQIRFNVI